MCYYFLAPNLGERGGLWVSAMDVTRLTSGKAHPAQSPTPRRSMAVNASLATLITHMGHGILHLTSCPPTSAKARLARSQVASNIGCYRILDTRQPSLPWFLALHHTRVIIQSTVSLHGTRGYPARGVLRRAPNSRRECSAILWGLHAPHCYHLSDARVA